MRREWLRDRRLWIVLAVAGEAYLVFLLTKRLSAFPGTVILGVFGLVLGLAIVWISPQRKELLAYLIAVLLPWTLIGIHVLDFRITLFDIMTCVIIVLYVSEKLLSGDARIGRRYLSGPMWLLIGAAFLSVASADHKLASLRIIMLMLQGLFLYLFIIKSIRTLAQAKRIILVFAFAAALPALLALYEFRTGVLISPTGSEALPKIPLGVGEHVRPDGPFLNSNSLAAQLVLALPILGATLFVWRSVLIRSLNLVVLFCVTLGLVVSLSRTNWAAAGISLGAVSVFALSFRYGRRILLATLIPLAVTAVLVARTAPVSLAYRLGSLFMLRKDLAVQIRLELWQAARDLFLGNPLIGIGIGNFVERYPPYVATWVRDGYANAHNAFFNIAAEMGIVGLVGICWLLVVSVRAAARNYRYAIDQDTKVLALGVLGAWIAFWVSNLGDFVWVTPHHVGEIGIMWVFFALTAVLEAARKRQLLGAEADARYQYSQYAGE